MWHGDYRFLLRNLIAKDFKVRYRNMSLGVFWSLLNPLVMMTVITFVFTQIFPNYAVSKHFGVFVLCGLVPFSFFTLAWSTGTTSILDNAMLIKRVPIPRQVVPVASVLSNCVHLLIQVALLLLFALIFGAGVNIQWLWLPLVWALAVIFVTGLCLVTAGLNVYVRDMRYVVESANTVLFWLVPIFYPFSLIPQRWSEIYQYNPLAALVLALRNILLDAKAPPLSLLYKLTLSSALVFAIGWLLFDRLKRRFYDYL